MQQRQSDVLKRKIVLLDPLAICMSSQYRPMLWTDDHYEVSMCGTRKRKQATRMKEHRDIVRKVGACISLQMQQWQDSDVIWAPYYFQ